MEDHEECRRLDEETYRIIGHLTNTRELLQKAGRKDKEENDMCNAIREMIEDGRAEGENTLAALISRLFLDNRIDDAKLAASDEKARKRLYLEYGLAGTSNP